MSETLAGSSARTRKHTCAKCKRTVYVVVIDGARVETDPELISVVPFDGAPRKIMARRSHAEMCTRYQIEDEKRAAKAKLRKPLSGRREPGQ